MDVHGGCEANLAHVVQTLCHVRLGFAAAKRRQQHARKDRDNPDHDQQLD
jgi:hypothetical protein